MSERTFEQSTLDCSSGVILQHPPTDLVFIFALDNHDAAGRIPTVSLCPHDAVARLMYYQRKPRRYAVIFDDPEPTATQRRYILAPVLEELVELVELTPGIEGRPRYLVVYSELRGLGKQQRCGKPGEILRQPHGCVIPKPRSGRFRGLRNM